MPTVLLSNDDITVLGPPETVELLVDIGPTGTRGSQVFVGNGNPNEIEIGQTPLLNDLYLNIASGDEYSYLYQYVSEPGGNTWIAVLKMTPTLYSKILQTTFSTGSASLSIPISDIATVTGSTLTASNFNIQYQIKNQYPTSSSITSVSVGSGILTINFSAIKYNSTWSNLTGEVDVHILITIV